MPHPRTSQARAWRSREDGDDHGNNANRDGDVDAVGQNSDADGAEQSVRAEEGAVDAKGLAWYSDVTVPMVEMRPATPLMRKECIEVSR